MNPAYIGRGTLQVVVTVGDDPSPIQGARVRVTDPADGAVLAELTTDSSGQTETIELPTPPIEDSIAESDVRPYATYNVTATAEGFETLHISGVQLLPGKGIMDTEDFLVSNILLPGGSLVFLLFCVTRWGWGFDKYLAECNHGSGMKLPRWLKPYLQFVLPILILIIMVQGLL